RGHLVELSSLTPNFKVGQECVFLLRREVDGSWTPLPFQTIHCRGGNPERQALRDYFHQGARGRFPATPRSARVDQGTDQGTAGIPGSVVTPTGYMETSGLPTRFTRCDGGESIPCLVDIDPGKLPTGMDVAGALAAVEEAFHAWSSVSSLRFRIEGITSFGTAANLVAKNDGHIRIQLHDTYNVAGSGV